MVSGLLNFNGPNRFLNLLTLRRLFINLLGLKRQIFEEEMKILNKELEIKK